MSKTGKTPQAIRGTQDIFGPEAEAFAFVVETFERVRKLYRFRRVEMPVFERTEVFSRAIGETTDVVSKEMYSFLDRGDESLTLRPEFTAGMARAYITNGWQQHAPVKLATHGPLFRYERPQKGRYRQFHQLDAEIIGAGEPQADVELLAMADQLLRELGIEGVSLHLNTLGDADSRDAWRAALVEHFRAVRGELSEDSQDRLEKNSLRILDSKDPRDRRFVADTPKIDAFLSDEALKFFESVTCGLDAAAVKWTRAESLVRGLDYYRHTAFEFVPDEGSAAAAALGSQSTVLGGGRYDGLMESLGGKPTPAVGWAAGIERLAMLVAEGKDWETKSRQYSVVHIAVVPESSRSEALAYEIVSKLRQAKFARFDRPFLGVEAYPGSFNKAFQRAAKNSAAILVISAEGDDASRGFVRFTLGKYGTDPWTYGDVVDALGKNGIVIDAPGARSNLGLQIDPGGPYPITRNVGS